jgi:hypothetical protein
LRTILSTALRLTGLSTDSPEATLRPQCRLNCVQIGHGTTNALPKSKAKYVDVNLSGCWGFPDGSRERGFSGVEDADAGK